MAALSDQFQPRRRNARYDQVRETAPAYPKAVRHQTLGAAVPDEIVCRIVEVAQPDRIVLFGSAARRKMGLERIQAASERSPQPFIAP